MGVRGSCQSVYFPQKNQHIWSQVGGRVIFQSEFSSSPRVMAVRGCTRSLPPIFTGCLSKLRLVTEVMLLLNACIRQILASNLMNLGWICMQETKTQWEMHRNMQSRNRAGPTLTKMWSNFFLIPVTAALIRMPNTAECTVFYSPFTGKLCK